jgi:hypothetical protein
MSNLQAEDKIKRNGSHLSEAAPQLLHRLVSKLLSKRSTPASKQA